MRFSFLRYLSPLHAIRDLRRYLQTRRPHELWFMMASLVITAGVMFAFFKDSHVESPYKGPQIIYVQQWPANRTDAQIIAQQKIDGPKEQAEKDALKKAQDERRAEFKRLDDKLKAMGI